MVRIPHYLKHNVMGEQPRQAIFFDTETNEHKKTLFTSELTLKFGMACYTRTKPNNEWTQPEWFKFTDNTAFWEWVTNKTRPKTKLYLFAHNLVFDLTITRAFTSLTDLGWKLVKAIVDDPPTILQFKLDTSSLCFVDTFNYFHSSLAELGQSIGHEKLPMPVELDSSASWDTYCKRDVEILKDSMLTYLTFIKDNDLGNFQLTIASQAFTAYRHRFMGKRIFIDNNPKALTLARDSYHGGRTEAFFVGEKTGDFYLLDVNSMYPFVMATNKFPTVLKGVFNRASEPDLKSWLDSYSVIADVTLTTPENCFPLKTKEALIFPTGKFRCSLSTPELGLALAKGYITRIHRVAVYQCAPLFEKYVYTLYNLRLKYHEANNIAFEYLCKLMLNTLYGKFGQNGRVYEDHGEALNYDIKSWTEWDADTHEIIKFRQFAGKIQSYKTESESFNSHPAISSHVCAYARIWLWKLITEAGIENVYYMDTDSLVVNKEGYDTLNMFHTGDSLGELKLVKRFKHLVIHGPKDYVFDELVRIKGVSKKAVKLDSNTYRQDKFGKFKTMVKKGSLDTMTITKEIKHLKREYRKGWVTYSGRVEPFTIEDENFDLVTEVFKRKAHTELTNQIILIGEGLKLNDWLDSEVKAMENDLNARTIPYNGAYNYGTGRSGDYFPRMNGKELDARWLVFSDYLKTHPLVGQSQT